MGLFKMVITNLKGTQHIQVLVRIIALLTRSQGWTFDIILHILKLTFSQGQACEILKHNS